MNVKIDKHLNWDSHIDFLIDKLNSRICLLKKAKTYLNYRQRNLLWNTLDDSTRSITTLRNFKKYISNKYADRNSKLDHFTIYRTF